MNGAAALSTSPRGPVGSPGQPHYTAAKHGVLGLTRCAAQDYLNSGIRTNAILPGLTETPMTDHLLSDPGGDKLIRMMPGGRMASARASWVNGQGISVDGGAVMH